VQPGQQICGPPCTRQTFGTKLTSVASQKDRTCHFRPRPDVTGYKAFCVTPAQCTSRVPLRAGSPGSHAAFASQLPCRGAWDSARWQQLTCETGCEEITAGHVFDGHARLALQKAGHKLRLELLGGSWERRASRSTHRGSLAEGRHADCYTSVQQQLGWRTRKSPLPQAYQCHPYPGPAWGMQH